MSWTLQELFARKSVRVYEKQPIAQTEKEAILRASLEAPTAGNMTMFTILDITDPSLKEQLVKTCDSLLLHRPRSSLSFWQIISGGTTPIVMNRRKGNPPVCLTPGI